MIYRNDEYMYIAKGIGTKQYGICIQPDICGDRVFFPVSIFGNKEDNTEEYITVLLTKADAISLKESLDLMLKKTKDLK